VSLIVCCKPIHVAGLYLYDLSTQFSSAGNRGSASPHMLRPAMTAVERKSPGPVSKKSSVRIVHLEDDSNDVALVRETLKAEGIACEISNIKTRMEFLTALELGEMDMVLSDYALPAFDGLTALDLARSRRPDIPFIIVSGTLGEELAIESFKRGATDYVLKERLSRLGPAVRRAVKDVAATKDRRRLEAQFIEAQKMEVIGQLAGGVAHDFNNIIAVLMGYCELIMQALGPDNPVKGQLEAMSVAADRAAGLTRQLLIFSRKQTVQPVVLDLTETVGGMEKMLRRLIDEHIELVFDRDKHPNRIKADPGYVGQVLMNLVVNARDAMPKGGTLRVRTGSVTLDQVYANRHPGIKAGQYAMFSVSDTGTGMSDEVKGRLFEAFFTTKPKGKGTGLGLVTCKTIVQQCGGNIDVASELGKGTTFTVYFPQVDLPLNTAGAVQPGSAPRGTETVLVVEDEPVVRRLAASILGAQGYEVLTAINGQEGLRVAREHKGQPLALVLTDVVMPQMSGKVMAEWLRAIYPQLKVLFTSGYTDEAVAQDGNLERGTGFLPKPFTPGELARKVRELLDDSKPAGAA
jgi:two-component system, cell cycle sensor histidine kinase and response regulator CckA